MISQVNTSGISGYGSYSSHWERPKPVMKIGKVMVYGGSAYLFSQVPNPSLFICLSDTMRGTARPVVTGNETAYRQLPGALFSKEVPVIYLNWPDGDVVDLSYDWWMELIRYIETLPEGTTVGIGCMGGHGRTGTVLAILAGLMGYAGNGDPVVWVRKHYCKEAVETERQCEYIETITGLDVLVFGSLDAFFADSKNTVWRKDEKSGAWYEVPITQMHREADDKPVVMGPPGGWRQRVK